MLQNNHYILFEKDILKMVSRVASKLKMVAFKHYKRPKNVLKNEEEEKKMAVA